MLLINLWLFTLSIVVLWGLFIVAKIHAFKFKNFSNHIVKVTSLLIIFLTSLTLLWYSVIIFSTTNSTGVENYSSYEVKEVNY